MLKFTTFARQSILAVLMLIGSGAAFAGPIYQVTIHTQTYSGESGLIDFGFGSDTDAPLAIAELWNISGAFGAEFDRGGQVEGSVPGHVVFRTSGLNNTYLTQEANFGDDFIFNVSFSGDYETVGGPNGASFLVALYEAGLNGDPAQVVRFDLYPGFVGELASVIVMPDDVLATVSEVPEPSQLLLMLSALAMAAFALRRKA